MALEAFNGFETPLNYSLCCVRKELDNNVTQSTGDNTKKQELTDGKIREAQEDMPQYLLLVSCLA